MTDGSLSQEEIDALLSGAAPFGDTETSTSTKEDDLLSALGTGDGKTDTGTANSDAIAAALGTGFPPPKSPPLKPSMLSGGIGNTSNLSLLMDVTLSLTVELGRTSMLIKDVLRLSEGAVVELDKTVNEDLDLLANGKLIGRGKIVVIDDYYGVLVTHIIDPMERLNMLS